MGVADHTYLIVGLGSIGQRHARNLRQLGAGRILAARSGLGQRPVPAELGLEEFPSLEAALAAGPTLSLVCNPTSLHVPTTQRLLAAGQDVLLEKPLAHNLDGVADLLALAARQQRLLFVAYTLRFHPLVEQTRAWLAEGRLGPVRYVRASVGQYPPAWAPQYDYRQNYAVRQDLGGGCLRTFIHEVDLLLYLLGAPQTVLAMAGHYSTLETDAEDIAEIILGYEQCLGSVHIDYVQKGRRHSRYLQIIGEEASLWLDFTQAELTLTGAAGAVEEIKLDDFDFNQLFLDELRHIVDCAETRTPPRANGEAGALGVQCVLAALESSATGRRVDVRPWPGAC